MLDFEQDLGNDKCWMLGIAWHTANSISTFSKENIL